jgi:hypothetical protein
VSVAVSVARGTPRARAGPSEVPQIESHEVELLELLHGGHVDTWVVFYQHRLLACRSFSADASGEFELNRELDVYRAVKDDHVVALRGIVAPSRAVTQRAPGAIPLTGLSTSPPPALPGPLSAPLEGVTSSGSRAFDSAAVSKPFAGPEVPLIVPLSAPAPAPASGLPVPSLLIDLLPHTLGEALAMRARCAPSDGRAAGGPIWPLDVVARVMLAVARGISAFHRANRPHGAVRPGHVRLSSLPGARLPRPSPVNPPLGAASQPSAAGVGAGVGASAELQPLSATGLPGGTGTVLAPPLPRWAAFARRGAAPLEVQLAIPEQARLVPCEKRSVVDTNNYLSPEEHRQERPTLASDIYALGGVLCGCLVGVPWLGMPAAVVTRRVSQGVSPLAALVEPVSLLARLTRPPAAAPPSAGASHAAPVLAPALEHEGEDLNELATLELVLLTIHCSAANPGDRPPVKRVVRDLERIQALFNEAASARLADTWHVHAPQPRRARRAAPTAGCTAGKADDGPAAPTPAAAAQGRAAGAGRAHVGATDSGELAGREQLISLHIPADESATATATASVAVTAGGKNRGLSLRHPSATPESSSPCAGAPLQTLPAKDAPPDPRVDRDAGQRSAGRRAGKVLRPRVPLLLQLEGKRLVIADHLSRLQAHLDKILAAERQAELRYLAAREAARPC